MNFIKSSLHDNHIIKILFVSFVIISFSASMVTLTTKRIFQQLMNYSSPSHSPLTLSPTSAAAVDKAPTSSLPTELTIPSKVKEFILQQIVNKSKAAIVVGFVDPNGTHIFNFGNISKANNIPVNGSTLFNIGSITKTFTTLLLVTW